jgi:tRNA threonylcarbamoyladenosine biosynthesis protein TsaE
MIDRELADADDTRRAGAGLGAALAPGDVVALIGDLGAGKTTFVQGVVAEATSPTFALIHEYGGGRIPIVHADLYRIERARELDDIGLDDRIRAGDAAVLIEWADRFPVVPPDHLRIELSHAGDRRRVRAAATGPRSAALLAAWAW